MGLTMTPATRKNSLKALRRMRERVRNAELAHKGLLGSYNRLYDEFFREKARATDLQARLDKLLDGRVDEDFAGEHVRCEWRVSKILLKYARDRSVVWEEVARKLRSALMKFETPSP